MVNCKNCGAPLSLDSPVCPHCGTPNPEAAEHLKKLAQLDRQYRKTRYEVESEVKKTNKGYKLLIILIMLMLANFLLIPVYGMSYDIADRINASKFSKEEVKAKMDELLEKGEYAEFYLYYDRYDLHYDVFPDYNQIAYLSADYSELCKHLSEFLYGTDNYSDPLVRLCQDMKDFVSNYKMYDRRELSDFTRKHLNNINAEFELLLKTYLNFTDDDIAQINDKSNSELVIMTAGRLNDEE